jgi:trehalose 6-phosphate phosphatase
MTCGKEVLEIRPPVSVDKGTASANLVRQLGAAGNGSVIVYVGDDRTDEDAFRQLRREWARAVTIRVLGDAFGGAEPQDTSAEFQLADTQAVSRFLMALASLG